ncbi:hypothetical protein [Limnohabitans sp. Bal53]|nr:hypothetical protein [Limnohabitans sp. Bal53]
MNPPDNSQPVIIKNALILKAARDTGMLQAIPKTPILAINKALL